MNPDEERFTSNNSTLMPTYYLILDDVAAATESLAFDINTDELNEIQQIGKLVLEVTDDHPVFMTST